LANKCEVVMKTVQMLTEKCTVCSNSTLLIYFLLSSVILNIFLIHCLFLY